MFTCSLLLESKELAKSLSKNRLTLRKHKANKLGSFWEKTSHARLKTNTATRLGWQNHVLLEYPASVFYVCVCVFGMCVFGLALSVLCIQGGRTMQPGSTCTVFTCTQSAVFGGRMPEHQLQLWLQICQSVTDYGLRRPLNIAQFFLTLKMLKE